MINMNGVKAVASPREESENDSDLFNLRVRPTSKALREKPITGNSTKAYGPKASTKEDPDGLRQYMIPETSLMNKIISHCLRQDERTAKLDVVIKDRTTSRQKK